MGGDHLAGGLVAQQSGNGLKRVLIGSILLTPGQDDPIGISGKAEDRRGGVRSPAAPTGKRRGKERGTATWSTESPSFRSPSETCS